MKSMGTVIFVEGLNCRTSAVIINELSFGSRARGSNEHREGSGEYATNTKRTLRGFDSANNGRLTSPVFVVAIYL